MGLYDILAALDAAKRTTRRNLSDLYNDPRGYAEKIVGHLQNQNAGVAPVVSRGELSRRPMTLSEIADQRIGQADFGAGLGMVKPVGASTMLLGGGKGASRTGGSLPESVNLPGFHWSNEPSLMQTSPGRYGTGIKGAEAERLAGAPDIRPRTYFYTDDMAREAGLGSNQYRADLKDVYPASDPLGLNRGDYNEFERAVKAKGFKGYEGNGAVVYFEPAGVARHTQGTVAQPPRPAVAEITDTTEVLAGDRARHAVGAEKNDPYQEEMMKWLAASNRIYPKLGLPGRDEMAIGRYTTPEGKVEFNPVNAYSIPYSPQAEEAVGMWNAVKAPMLAQNARGSRTKSGGGA
jgi:hypothetical protein